MSSPPVLMSRFVDGCNSQHYIEYLVQLINQHQIDPLPVYDGSELIAQLRRMAEDIPERLENESDQQFYGRCAQVHTYSSHFFHARQCPPTPQTADRTLWAKCPETVPPLSSTSPDPSIACDSAKSSLIRTADRSVQK